MAEQKTPFRKRMRDWAGGIIIGALAAGFIVAAGASDMGASDMGEYDRILPFDAQSMWLMKQARAIIETYQVDSAEKPVEESKILYGAIRGMVEAWG